MFASALSVTPVIGQFCPTISDIYLVQPGYAEIHGLMQPALLVLIQDTSFKLTLWILLEMIIVAVYEQAIFNLKIFISLLKYC